MFLETQSRYLQGYYAPALFGFVFDAAQLVQHGALVCSEDLGGAFSDALYQAVQGRVIDDPIPPAAIEQAQTLAKQRCLTIKAKRRLRGPAALELLQTGAYCEILMPAPTRCVGGRAY